MLRPAIPTDAAQIAAIYAPFVDRGVVSFESIAPDTTEMAQRIERTLETHPWLVAENESGDITGYAYATRFRDRAAYRFAAETSVYIRPTEHRRGLGTELSLALLDALRAARFRIAVAVITLPNDPSVRMHERIGYQPAGRLPAIGWKFDRWHDIGYWSLDLGGEDPRPPA